MSEKRQKYVIPLFAVLLSLFAASIVMLAMGKNPLAAFLAILRGSGFLPKSNYAAKKNLFTDFMGFLNMFTPMLLAALAVAVASKAGLFNIGVSGQMLLAGFVATVTVGYSSLPAAIALPLVVLIGIVVGAFAGGIIGLLKYKFNINEVVSSIMLNYIFQNIISFFINQNYMNPVSRQSNLVNQSARLTLLDVEAFGLKFDVPLSILFIIPALIFVKILFDRTRTGYELKTVGLSRGAARYAGMSVGKNIIMAMIISGALAGLAGVTYYLGYYGSIQPKTLTSVGFDAIAVSILGNSSPFGIFFSSILITTVSKGSTYMSSLVGVPYEIASVVTGLILLFSACGAYFKQFLSKREEGGAV